MRIGEIIGTVTLCRCHPSLTGARYRLVVPLSLENLRGDPTDRAEPLVAYDSFGSGLGSTVAFSESREAAQPFHPDEKPIDASVSAILDSIAISD